MNSLAGEQPGAANTGPGAGVDPCPGGPAHAGNKWTAVNIAVHINHGGGQTLRSGGPEKNGHFGRDRLALCCGSRTQQGEGGGG